MTVVEPKKPSRHDRFLLPAHVTTHSYSSIACGFLFLDGMGGVYGAWSRQDGVVFMGGRVRFGSSRAIVRWVSGLWTNGCIKKTPENDLRPRGGVGGGDWRCEGAEICVFGRAGFQAIYANRAKGAVDHHLKALSTR